MSASYIPALYSMAAICKALERKDDAIQYCKQILKLDAGNIKAQRLLQKLSP